MDFSIEREELIVVILALLLILILMCVFILLNDGFFFARMNPWKRNEKGLPGDFSEEFERKEQAAGKYGAPKGLWLGCLLFFSILFFEDMHPLLTYPSLLGIILTFFAPFLFNRDRRDD